MTVHIPTATFATPTSNPSEATPDDTPPLTASRRQDGWSAAAQRMFLEAIAEGLGVDVACACVGLSSSSAYAFRRSPRGAAFALGWRAATLLAREAVAERLMVRALHGQVDTITRDDGSTITRHRHDNRLGMSLLARLDRQVEQAPDADVKAARLVAQEFDAFLGLVDKDDGPARAGLFLARRCQDFAEDQRDLAPIYALASADRLVRTGVATAGEVAIADLDPAARADWTAEQWARAEAAGLVAFAEASPEDEEDTPDTQESQHSEPLDPAEAGPDHIWWEHEGQEWRTDFPPPDDFCGIEQGVYGMESYERQLSFYEQQLCGEYEREITPEEAHMAEVRDAYFDILARVRRREAAEAAAALEAEADAQEAAHAAEQAALAPA
jgi:hypothetical protein